MAIQTAGDAGDYSCIQSPPPTVVVDDASTSGLSLLGNRTRTKLTAPPPVNSTMLLQFDDSHRLQPGAIRPPAERERHTQRRDDDDERGAFRFRTKKLVKSPTRE